MKIFLGRHRAEVEISKAGNETRMAVPVGPDRVDVTMKKKSERSATAFIGDALLIEGPLIAVATAVKNRLNESPQSAVVIIDDETGRSIDLDLRGSTSQIRSRIDGNAKRERTAKTSVRRGRPSLGVISREVTLLPRHWDWLSKQRGGASATLRRLVDDARKRHGSEGDRAAAREALYRAMLVLGGNKEGFEEAARALFAGDRRSFNARINIWPSDISRYLRRLAPSAFLKDRD